MPSIAIPRRRKRPTIEDEDGAQSGSATPASTASKRTRRNDSSDDDDEDSPVPDGPVLPDSYLSQPNGSQVNGSSMQNGITNRQTANGTAGIPKHAPGAIVRVKLKNFVTYTEAEFYPNPSLNMVIGPNGTGKSTLVCAICLGLGWGPAVSLRACGRME